MVRVRICKRDVTARKNLPWPVNIPAKAITRTVRRDRIIKVRCDKIGHSNPLNGISVLVRFTRVAYLHQIFELAGYYPELPYRRF